MVQRTHIELYDELALEDFLSHKLQWMSFLLFSIARTARICMDISV